MSLLFGLRRGTPGFVFKPSAGNFLRFSTKTPAANSAAVKKSASSAAVTLAPRRGARRVGTLLIMSTMGLAYFQLENNRALCAAGGTKGGSDMPSPTDLLSKVLEKYQGEIHEMGFSGLAGMCSGYCLKRVSQEVAVGIGAVFMLLQGLQHAGYININYKKLNADVTKKLDIDGDGKLSSGDFKVLIDNITTYLADGLPSASGFASGFALGFYYA